MFLSLFRAVTERVKSLFATSAALELEAEFLTREAERRAELFCQANRYEAEGLHGIAQDLRRQAETASLQQPLAVILPAVEHFVGKNAALAQISPPTAPSVPHALAVSAGKKKGR